MVTLLTLQRQTLVKRWETFLNYFNDISLAPHPHLIHWSVGPMMLTITVLSPCAGRLGFPHPVGDNPLPLNGTYDNLLDSLLPKALHNQVNVNSSNFLIKNILWLKEDAPLVSENSTSWFPNILQLSVWIKTPEKRCWTKTWVWISWTVKWTWIDWVLRTLYITWCSCRPVTLFMIRTPSTHVFTWCGVKNENHWNDHPPHLLCPTLHCR